VSQLLYDDALDDETLFTLVSGAVGEGLAVKFKAHRKFVGRMPAPADILSGKVTTLDVKEISAMYALTTGLCYELKAASDDKTVPIQKMNEMVDTFLEYVMANFETELIVMGCKLLMKTYKIRFEQFSVKALVPFHKKYGKFVLESV